MFLGIRMVAFPLRAPRTHLGFDELSLALASLDGLLRRGGVVLSVRAGCGFCGGVLEKAGVWWPSFGAYNST